VSPLLPDRTYDVVIVGGALSGAATTILLLREQPALRVLIVEKSGAFTRRVGEATVEISSYFLGRVLGLTQYLNEAHLVKQGMRFWFCNEQTRSPEQCSEIGGRYLSRVPAFQVDRATLDEEVLRRAQAAGAELWRPAAVQNIKLMPGGLQTVIVRQAGSTSTISARWVIDASGVAALLARQNGWWRPNHQHPTTAAWARWRGVKDWDSVELAQQYPQFQQEFYGMRGTATNHLLGDGWWAWCIPLKGGDVSIGVVFDQRLVDWPDHGSLGERLKEFLCRHPVGQMLLADAQCIEGDAHWRKNLSYFSSTYAGDGFALVGDAGAFMDPFYSPGMDWVAFTATASVNLIRKQQRGEAIGGAIEKHNRDFTRSYERWFQAVYHEKYYYMGDYDLMRLAFLFDLGLYYGGVASQPFKRGPSALCDPVFSLPVSGPFYHFMRGYSRRFAAIARARRQRGLWGRRNGGQRFLFAGYSFDGGTTRPLAKALLNWALLELTEGWRTWFSSAPAPVSKPLPVISTAQ